MSDAIRRSAVAFIAGAAATFVGGLLVQFAVRPASGVADDRFSYPWSSDVFVVVSIVYAVMHVLVAIGLVGFGRSGAAGPSRLGRYGTPLAVIGTALLAAGELASIPVRDAALDDAGAAVVVMLFAVGTLLSAVGLLMAGWATVRAGVWVGWRRFTPLLAGLWTTALLGLVVTAASAVAIAVYGGLLLAMAVALHTRPVPVPGVAAAEPQLGRA